MKVKALFLDFDGVITTEKSNFVFDPLLLARLGCILVATGAKIVIITIKYDTKIFRNNKEFRPSLHDYSGCSFRSCNNFIYLI